MSGVGNRARHQSCVSMPRKGSVDLSLGISIFKNVQTFLDIISIQKIIQIDKKYRKSKTKHCLL